MTVFCDIATMKKAFLFFLLIVPILLLAQKNPFIGKWEAVDDVTKVPVAVVEIYEEDGKLYGKVHDIFDKVDRKRVCTKCPGKDKNKPLLGLVILKGLKKDGNEYSGGKILDPKHGRLYDTYITLENDKTLKIRGYYGLSIFGRTQHWYRLKDK